MTSTHPNKDILAKYWNLFADCKDFSTFQKCLRKVAKECSDPKNYYLTMERFFSREFNGGLNVALYKENSYRKACGDIFEIFAEFFFRFFQSDDVFGCKDGTYKSTDDSVDVGCDGEFILKVNNARAFVQMKYRNDPKEKPFDKDVFASLFTDAALFHGFEYKNKDERLIFISNLNFGKRTFLQCATPIFQRCIKEMDDQIILIGKTEIEEKVDGHLGFWEDFLNFCK